MNQDLINQAALDRFTSAHAGVGITIAALGLPWWAALGITVGWELLENRIKDGRPDLFPYSSHDSLENSVTDSIAVVVAFAVTRHMLRRGLTPAGQAALRSAVGATAGAFVGSMSFGLAGRVLPSEDISVERQGLTTQRYGHTGYLVGCAIGGAVAGATIEDKKYAEQAAFGGLVGGAAFGPLGAALGTYIAVGVAEEAAA